MTTLDERRGSAIRPSAPSTGAYFVRTGFSWSGIWAGAFCAVAAQMLCGVLAGWVSPQAAILGGQLPLVGMARSVGIWYWIYTTGAMLLAGYTAARQSSGLSSSSLHAMCAWAVATVVGSYGLALVSERVSVGLSLSAQSVVGSTGVLLVSPGWLVGGLVFGLIASQAGARLSDATNA